MAELAQSTNVDLDAFVVVDGACPPSPPGGDLLILHPPPGVCFGTRVGATVEHPEITSWDDGDPRLRFLTLDGVHLAHASLLEPEGAPLRLVKAREGTIVSDISTRKRTATLVGFDPGDSDWPLKASFVLFVRNLLEQARIHRAHGIAGPVRAGESMRVSLPESATHVEATEPGGERIKVSHRGGVAVLPDVARAGFYTVAWQGPQAGATLVPANLTSAAESDLTPRPLPAAESRVMVTAAAQPGEHRELTWLFALLALGLVVFDVLYFTRDARTTSPVAGPAVARSRLLEQRCS